MHFTAWFSCLLVLSAFARASEAAESAGCDQVRAFFSALDREDYVGAINRTVGAARSRTLAFVGELKGQAAKKHVGLDVIARKIDVAPVAIDQVSAAFDIDIVARFMFVSRVVKRIRGQASFSLDPSSGRISAIEGALAP